MKSVLTRVTKLEKKYMERKAEKNDAEPPPEDDDEQQDPNPVDQHTTARSWMTNM
jgi:hypothetical protein